MATNSKQNAPHRPAMPAGAAEVGQTAKAASPDEGTTAAGTISTGMTRKEFAFKVRAGQREFERGVELHRVCGLLARRQFGKTTIASRISLKKMMKRPGHTVVFGSVKLDLGREIVRKEAEAMQKAFRMIAAQAADAETLLQAVDVDHVSKSAGSASRPHLYSADDWAEIYEACRLEFRLYHSRTVYSRTKVVALNAAAVGETGDLVLDEVGRVKQFREVVEAVMPIIASNPEFRCIYTTTPPPDDTHYSFELLAPPIGAELAVKPKGNWYRSELGVWVLRITAWDAFADGVPLYDDDTGAPLTPEQSRGKAHDKDAWDRNYGCRFVLGGTAACGLLQLDTAQRRGIAPDTRCQLFQVNNDGDFETAVKWIATRARLDAAKIGLGWDLATTTSETSNPSSMTVLEQNGTDLAAVAVVLWKTADPDVAMERCRSIVTASKPRRLCVDATNERYFAQTVRKELGALVPVELVIGSETIDVPGQDEPITMKQFLGGELVAELDDNHLTLPPERYLREDWRLVRKEKGQFVCEPDASGRHGDSFDSTKLALRALRSTAGALTSTTGIYMGGGLGQRRAARLPKFQPRRLA